MTTLIPMLEGQRRRDAERRKVTNIRSVVVDGVERSIGPVRKGAMNEMRACGHLLANGYDVFRNMSPEGPADIIAINWSTGERVLIDVKSGAFSVDSVDGEETMARAKDLGIAIMVVGDDGTIDWHNRDIEQRVYASAEDYARSVA